MFIVQCHIPVFKDGYDRARKRDAVKVAGVPCDAHDSDDKNGRQVLMWEVKEFHVAVRMRKNLTKAGYPAQVREEITTSPFDSGIDVLDSD